MPKTHKGIHFSSEILHSKDRDLLFQTKLRNRSTPKEMQITTVTGRNNQTDLVIILQYLPQTGNKFQIGAIHLFQIYILKQISSKTNCGPLRDL